MIYRVKQYRHRFLPLRLGLWFGRDLFRWEICFTDSCRYMISGNDQKDINKLIGVGFFPGHHTDSARLGWSYDPVNDKMLISAYCYVGKQRVIRPIRSIDINTPYVFELSVTPSSYIFRIGSSSIAIHKEHSKSICFLLRPYFGGNQPAPRDMEIKIRTV